VPRRATQGVSGAFATTRQLTSVTSSLALASSTISRLPVNANWTILHALGHLNCQPLITQGYHTFFVRGGQCMHALLSLCRYLRLIGTWFNISRRNTWWHPQEGHQDSRRHLEAHLSSPAEMGIRPMFRATKTQSTQLFRYITRIDIRQGLCTLYDAWVCR
jgi:hypothetical protein